MRSGRPGPLPEPGPTPPKLASASWKSGFANKADDAGWQNTLRRPLRGRRRADERRRPSHVRHHQRQQQGAPPPEGGRTSTYSFTPPPPPRLFLRRISPLRPDLPDPAVRPRRLRGGEPSPSRRPDDGAVVRTSGLSGPGTPEATGTPEPTPTPPAPAFPFHRNPTGPR